MTEQTPEVPTLEIPSLDEINLETLQNYDYTSLIEFASHHGTKILGAVAIFVIGKWLVKRLVRLTDRTFEKAGVDRTLGDFIENILFGIGMIIVIIAALSQMGIETTSFAAILAAAGLAIGLALQGSLSNFAAGVLIILFRPFKAGDYVEAGGTAGTVEEISIFTTTMTTPDNREIIIPNNNITTGIITNYSAHKKRRLDLVIGVAYDADLKKAQTLLTKIVEKHDAVLDKPEAVVAVNELGASSVDFIVRPWVKTADYWTTRWDLLQTIKQELDKAGIGIPFPQRDVNLFIKEGEMPKKKTTTKKK